MKNNNVHAMLLALVGGYLVYMAYHLWENLQSGSQDMSRGMFIAMIALLAAAGLGVMVYAFLIWRSGKKKDDSSGPDGDGTDAHL